MNKSLERFIKYAKVDTQADDTTHLTPSTEKQKNLSKLLVQELHEMGIDNAHMDEFGLVYASIDGEDERIAFNAHIDTALEVTDTNVNPQLIKNYSGEDFNLNDSVVLSTNQFPKLKEYIGCDLLVTDGNTLLGADDKAGIAIIMSMLQYFVDHPEIKHHPLSIVFSVDEEIGEGADHIDIKKLNAEYGYTIDGADIDCIDYENFYAQGAKLHVKGVSVHPGEGKNALVNALVVTNDFIARLPSKETPFDANYDEGYWHINNLNGSSDECEAQFILREFDKEKLEQRDLYFNKVANELRQKYPKATIDLEIYNQYNNMRPFVEKDPRAVVRAENVMRKLGITPKNTKIRGGTDGARLSEMGLITPNLGTGSHNHHGRYEFLVVQEFEKMIEIVIEIAKV